jgi:hypothetical protein
MKIFKNSRDKIAISGITVLGIGVALLKKMRKTMQHSAMPKFLVFRLS